MNKKIYLDCTHTYSSGLNTGIQRTVRNIASNINSKDYPNISLVFYYKDNFYKFDEFPEVNIDSNKNKLKIILKKIYKSVRNILSFIPIIKKIMLNPKLILFLNKMYDMLFQKQNIMNNERIIFNKEDTLLLLDSAWSDVDFKYLKKLKNNNIRIISIVYDLIPAINPEYCSEDLVSIFNNWIKNITPLSDKFIGISKDVQKKLAQFSNLDKQNIDYFYLGADFKKNDYNQNKIDLNYTNLFKSNNVFITVSTIEPRKNHEYILNAFEKLWEKNIDVKYIIIGRIGWKVESFIQRVQNHKEFKKRLFMLNNIDDELLLYAYKNSKALIFASFAEGFGLPIIESLYNKLQVLASNIDIHKEIGKDKVSYFDLDDTNSLVELIEKDNFYKNIDDFKWINWEESTKQLINKVLEDN